MYNLYDPRHLERQVEILLTDSIWNHWDEIILALNNPLHKSLEISTDAQEKAQRILEFIPKTTYASKKDIFIAEAIKQIKKKAAQSLEMLEQG